uniref:Uncharacterized protein n=1 Tax=Cajanus cajan TaxID=3821 RepID=A0A151SBN2_CAJCA|nr:hypothetical protein KK1_025955 [Cajanus cajan]
MVSFDIDKDHKKVIDEDPWMIFNYYLFMDVRLLCVLKWIKDLFRSIFLA